MKFEELNLTDNVLDALYDMRFDECTPVQEKCIPPILDGHDVMGVAQTGTGKTAAYLLPILSKLDSGDYPKDVVNCIVMSPTRELAQQIDQAMQGFSYYLPDVSSVAVYGGNDGNRYDQEMKSMRLGADVIIATPGRLISHISMGNIDLSKVSFFVLDEADRMLDMGFSDDIMKIASKLPDNCQTIMFSATMPKDIEKLAQSLLKNPVEVKLAVSKPAEKIKQSAYICYETQKLQIIQDIFKAGDLKRVIIFSGSKMKVKQINQALQKMKINSGEMHSDLEQAERDDIMFKFKSGQIDVLVATDIVARGIDIDDIAMVINFDVPHDAEDYVHRIGRTARADRDGVGITFVNEDDLDRTFKRIRCLKVAWKAQNTQRRAVRARRRPRAGGGKTVTLMPTRTRSNGLDAAGTRVTTGMLKTGRGKSQSAVISKNRAKANSKTNSRKSKASRNKVSSRSKARNKANSHSKTNNRSKVSSKHSNKVSRSKTGGSAEKDKSRNASTLNNNRQGLRAKAKSSADAINMPTSNAGSRRKTRRRNQSRLRTESRKQRKVWFSLTSMSAA